MKDITYFQNFVFFPDSPEFKNGNESKQVLQGEDVTLSCSADSNPPSNIRWVYTPAVNSNVTTEGHQKIITITRATSTNAGFYICVAENKVGRNTRFITLMITGMIIDSVQKSYGNVESERLLMFNFNNAWD